MSQLIYQHIYQNGRAADARSRMLENPIDAEREQPPEQKSPKTNTSVQMFRAEITEVVKSLVELNKLKIVLSSGLLALAFGVGSSSRIGDYSLLVLSLVPFVCLYVDFQYYHGLAKIFVIARFLSEVATPNDEVLMVRHYERFVARIRDQAAPRLFSFEAKAQLGSSLMLALITPLLGVVALYATPGAISSIRGGVMMAAILLGSAASGALLIWGSFRLYQGELRKMKTVPVDDVAAAEKLNR